MRLAAGHEERGGYERQAHQHRQSLFQLGRREDRSDDGGFDIHNIIRLILGLALPRPLHPQLDVVLLNVDGTGNPSADREAVR